MDIVFSCSNCHKKLVADHVDRGEMIGCPVCGKLIKIPVSAASPSSPHEVHPAHETPEGGKKKRKVVVRVPSDKTLAEMAAHEVKAETEHVAVPVPEVRYTEVVVGWICIIVGIVLEVLLPRAVFAYLPFFVGSFIMGIVLMVNRRLVHAAVLLLCTSISPPLLMQQNVWKNITGSGSSSGAPSAAKVQKLVFNPAGEAQIVTVEDVAPPPPKQAARERSPARTRRAAEKAPLSDEPRTQVADPFAGLAGEQGAATDLAAPAPAARNPAKNEDPYRDLIENTEEIPPLVSEEELANTQIGRDPGFVWQERSFLDPGNPEDPAPVVDVPFIVYADEGMKETYAATGRLGNHNDLQFEMGWDLAPHSGFTCIYVRYDDEGDWVTVAWQHPGHNWGDYAGGFDLSKATQLTFWAKGETGREMVEFMVGMEQSQNAVCRDSLRATTGIMRLHKEWKKYSLSLADLDRSRILTGFLFRIEGQGKPVVFCLDDIQFE
jgi:hypothetical protein